MFSSTLPDVHIDDLPVHELVLRTAAANPERRALIDGATGDALTYSELAQAIRSFAGGLAAAGFHHGDVLALFAPNSVHFPVVFHGASMAGLTVTTVNVLSTTADLTKQLADSGAKILVTVSDFLDRATAAALEAEVPVTWTVDAVPGLTSIRDVLQAGEAPPEIAFDVDNDIAALPYSSGTTGVAKGVMLTHRNLVANLAQMQATVSHGPDDTVLAVLPMFHIYGLQVLMNLSLAHGATVVTMSKFELEPYFAALASHRVTRGYVAPPIVVALAKHPIVDEYDLSALRCVYSAAAPLDSELAKAASGRLGVPVVQAYGMTEASPATHFEVLGHEGKPGSVGKLVPNTEARLVDPETGADAETYGEVWVRGPQVMKGYLNKPDATAETIDPEGWLHTGDVATIDSDGDWFIVDRVKELIKYKGYQVAPAELEAELLTHPAIADAAVVGHVLEGEEVPKAFVVRAATAEQLTDVDIMTYISERVAPYKAVRIVEFIETIPKSPSGKILRKDLRAGAR